MKRRPIKTLDYPTTFTSQFTLRPASKALAVEKQGEHVSRGSTNMDMTLGTCYINPINVGSNAVT
jgi:hypothetical protein